MKSFKSLLTLAIAFSLSSTAIAETKNPLESMKDSAVTQVDNTKQAVNSAKNTAKAAASEKVTNVKSAVTEKVASATASDKPSIMDKAKNTVNSAKSDLSGKTTEVKSLVEEKVAGTKAGAVEKGNEVKARGKESFTYAKETANKGVTQLNNAKEQVNAEAPTRGDKKSLLTDKININTADAKTLQKLSGIGEAKAKAIIDYRNQAGRIKDLAELAKVSGIGQATLEKVKDFIIF